MMLLVALENLDDMDVPRGIRGSSAYINTEFTQTGGDVFMVLGRGGASGGPGLSREPS